MENQMEPFHLVQIMNRVICSKDLKEALMLARPAFGNPMVLTSLAKTIVATTDEPDLADSRWHSLNETERVPLSCLFHTEILEAYQQSQLTRKPVVDSLADDGLPMLRKVLMVEDSPVGYLESPLYYGLPNSEQMEFFDLLGNFLATRMRDEMNHPSLPDNMLDYFAFDLLEGRITNPEMIEERLAYFQWDLMEKGLAQIISIRWLDRDDRGSVRFRQLAETLIQTFHTCRVFVYGLEIKMICSVQIPLEMDEEFIGRLSEILKDATVSAGISRPMDNLSLIADFNLQARKASEIGCVIEPERKLHTFDNLSVYYALEKACKDLNPDQFIHYGLVTLQKYDDAHDTNLVESLRVYLAHFQSIGEAAAALFIHRNTMNYRISKIVELTHLDLKDPGVVEHLIFSFSVCRFKESWGPEIGAGGLAFRRLAKPGGEQERRTLPGMP